VRVCLEISSKEAEFVDPVQGRRPTGACGVVVGAGRCFSSTETESEIVVRGCPVPYQSSGRQTGSGLAVLPQSRRRASVCLSPAGQCKVVRRRTCVTVAHDVKLTTGRGNP